jgi:hypothetical protein
MSVDLPYSIHNCSVFISSNNKVGQNSGKIKVKAGKTFLDGASSPNLDCNL